MNGHIRSKARLLARASTLALVAAAGSLGAAGQAQAACTTTLDPPASGSVTVAAPFTCVIIDDPVTNNVTNNNTVGDPGSTFVPFWVTDTVGGQFVNNGNISGGYASGLDRGALQISNGGTISNGIFNNGLITSTSGNGIQIGTGGEGAGQVNGGILNTNAISSGTGYGIAAIEGGLTGGFTNQYGATLNGGAAALYIGDGFTDDWQDGIYNAGQISGVSAGILMGDGGELSTVDFSGGITNYSGGTITSVGGAAIRVKSDIANFENGITNHGQISGNSGAIIIEADCFHGGITNTGTIVATGAFADAIYVNSTWEGNFDNGGLIDGSDSAFEFVGDTYDGDFINSDRMFGGKNGVILGDSYTNIYNGDGNAQFRNTGTIGGSDYGVRVLGNNVDMDFINDSSDPLYFPPGEISASSESGIGVMLAASNWSGNVTNSGTITGGYIGMVIGATNTEGLNAVTGSFNGTITNTGSIGGGQTGLYITAENFTGSVDNSGNITGDDGVGVNFVGASSDAVFGNKFSPGTFTNTGSIVGNSTGLRIAFDSITADILNDVGGYISGGSTGAYISANTFTGDITNNGVIEGFDDDTGLHIVTTGTHTGNIVNNGLLDASGNALHLEIDTLVGSIVNNGTIQANTGATAVLLDIGSNATFFNDGEISGNLDLGGEGYGGTPSLTLRAQNGGIAGNINGFGSEGNNDYVDVRGTHYFVDGGSENGTASNLASFDVNDGGTAVMGALAVGASGGTGYSFSNVDNVNVNNGGTLYIDKATTLNVDENYTQTAGGTLMFYLGAPGGEGFSDLEGTQEAGPGDYGQILVNGTATLDGTIAAFLDPDFGSASPGLTEVQYDNVIQAGSIVGDFDFTALIANNSLFELDSIKDGNTIDLRVLRSSLGAIDAPSNIVNTGDPFDANIAGRANGGGCGVAGFGWCVNQYAANEPGATSVMTDATPGEDPFAWLRSGSRRVGETAVWGRAVGVWGETDGDAFRPGTDFTLGGAIAGVDHVFAPQLLAGAAVQWTTTDVDFDLSSGDASVDSLEVGAYAAYGDARLFVNANVSYIWHDFEVNRVTGPNHARGDYNGDTFSAYVEGGKSFQTDGGLRIQPTVALSYSHLETDSYTETGTGTLLNVSDASLDALKSIIGARFAYSFTTGAGRSLVPEARILWSHEFMDDHSSHFVDPVGGPATWTLVDGEKFSRDTLVLGTGLTASLTASTTLFLDYDAGLNTDITTHTVSAGLRTRW